MKSAIEDYLRTMYSIFEKKHSELDEKTRKVSKKASDVNKKTKAVKDVNKKVKAVDIAKELKISRASVSAMVKKLAKMKYVDANLYSKISMTKKGEKEARRIMHNHRVIEVFLTDVLGYDLKKVHNEAHRLEHAFSESSIRKLDEFLGNPTISPFGKRIHTKKMKTTIICDSGAGNHKHPVCIKLHDKKSEGRLQVQS
ncbi:MAG: metal-dependent transcriptional regulator, partial [Nanoarchaeota archaeon]|nr:metal-dependent transcriptional regulator [Nanoarchaeota archaeon]